MNTLANTLATHTFRAFVALAFIFGAAMIATPVFSAGQWEPNATTTASFHLLKYVIGDSQPDGEHTAIPDFTFHLDGPIDLSMKSDDTVQLPVGTYTLTETGPAGFTLFKWDGSCNPAGVPNDESSTTFTINENDLGEYFGCQVYNDAGGDSTTTPQNGTLVVSKFVINNNGGTTATTSFSFQVNGGVAIAFEVDGSNSISLPPGTYNVTEVAAPGYTPSYSGCSQISVTSGNTSTCNITNDDIVPSATGTLIVNKVVVNDNGGTGTTSNFSFQVNGGNATAFEADGSNILTLATGTYSVTEVAAPGYLTTYSGCSNVVLTSSGTATCTITNDDVPPGNGTLIVNKVVINDNGGTGTSSNFSFQVNGGTTTAFEVDGSNSMTLPAGTYTITEVASSSYTTTYSGCTRLSLTASGTATCTITNDDVPPGDGGGGGNGGGGNGGNGGGGGSGKSISLSSSGGSNNNDDDEDEDEPQGEVAGAVAPVGAPNAGMGGAGAGSLATTLMLLLGLAISAATGRRVA